MIETDGDRGDGHRPLLAALEQQTEKYDGSDTMHDESSSRPKNKNGRISERKRHGARNQDRHKIFVKWLTDKFDLSASSIPEASEKNDNSDLPYQHILDVAGGKGEVSARLTMCERQHVVMVDPRPANIADCFERLVLPKIPNKWQQKLEQQRRDEPDFLQKVVDRRFRQLVTTFDDQTLSSSTELRATVENSSLLLGLHADGATEAIVDAALRYSKPFVVVPCCVFPNFSPHRFIQEADNGVVPVRSHEQFCRYLVAKDPRLVMEELPFAGRNIAIWWNGK